MSLAAGPAARAAWAVTVQLLTAAGRWLCMQRYEKGQEYEGHYDYFFHREGTENGGNRYLTVLM